MKKTLLPILEVVLGIAIGVLITLSVVRYRQAKHFVHAQNRDWSKVVLVLDLVNRNYVDSIDKEKFGLSRDEIYERFHNYNVFPRKYFHPLCSDFTCYHQLHTADEKHLLVATKTAQEVLSMPMYGELTEEDVRKICHILKHIREEA